MKQLGSDLVSTLDSSGHRNQATATRIDPLLSTERKTAGRRLIVPCGDQGIARDYYQFLKDGQGIEGVPGTVEFVIPEGLAKTLERQGGHPTEIVIFADRATKNQIRSLFAELQQVASEVTCHCLVVKPSLDQHLCPQRSDELQTSLEQTIASFRKAVTPRKLPEVVQPGHPHTRQCGGLEENECSSTAKNSGSRMTVIRTGYLLSPSSPITRRLKTLRRLRALIGPQLASTFVPGPTLFSAINSELALMHLAADGGIEEKSESPTHPCERRENVRRYLASQGISSGGAISGGVFSDCGLIRYVTILGHRRPWQSVLEDCTKATSAVDYGAILKTICRWTGLQWLIEMLVRNLICMVPSARQIDFHTLKPRTVHEIISLYNRHNFQYVQIAGYNNGVNHFGWKFPDRTVVLTSGLSGETRLSNSLMPERAIGIPEQGGAALDNSTVPEYAAGTGTYLTVDSGLTLKHCIQELERHDREFYVVPNYSWISMGTLFFVPIHGSGSQVSTLGDTIEDILLYDAVAEEFRYSCRGEEFFRDAMYDTSQHRLLLRLSLRVKRKSIYSVRHEKLEDPSAEDVLRCFEDADCSHVEIRKHRAADSAIDIRRYYVDSSSTPGVMEMPRDRIGRVWDRLEETPIASTLFHWFVRTFAFHVELFLTPEEFAIFWKHHKSLSISKIQLRQILRDNITHSACRWSNCISADLFLMRSNRVEFLGFLSTHLPNVRHNPGKQSPGSCERQQSVSNSDV